MLGSVSSVGPDWLYLKLAHPFFLLLHLILRIGGAGNHGVAGESKRSGAGCGIGAGYVYTYVKDLHSSKGRHDKQ